MKSTFELKWFKTSKHPDLIDALRLYTDYTEPAFRTDTKEIIHCIDTWNDSFPDPFYVVGFYYNRVLIGFSEFAYFSQEKFVIVDYLVIHEKYRKNNTFHQFIDDIENFLREQGLEYNYIVAEVGCYQENQEPPEEARHLIRLLKISGFGVIKCNYYVPRVGIYDYESEMRAVMMIHSLNKSSQIKKETFFQIASAIYHKYYQRWHNLFVDEEEKKKYDQEINTLIDRMQTELQKKKMIEINGLNGLFVTNTTRIENPLKERKFLKTITWVILFIVFVVLAGVLHKFIQTILKVDSETVNAILPWSLCAAGLAVLIIYDNKSDYFSRWVNRFFK